MKRVLFIAYYYPPLADSGTQRPLKFSKYLPDFGWDPIVLTVDNPPNRQQDPSLLREVRPGTRIVRVPMLSDIISRRMAAIGRPFGCADRIAAGLEWRLREWSRTPDIYASWRRPAVRAAVDLFRREGFDAIYATGYPWTSVLIGRDVARATGVPFVADFRDPWASDEMFDPPLTDAQRTHHFQLETSVVDAASRVLAVSGEMTGDLRRAHPGMAERFETIENGFDSNDLLDREEYPSTGAAFRLAYTGVWREGYGLDHLYDVLCEIAADNAAALDGFELVAAGFPPGEAERRGLGRWVTELGRVPHALALGLMHSAAALFVALPDGAYQRIALPGKLFEYLASERPVVLMGDGRGEAAQLLTRMRTGLVIAPGDRAALRDFIIRAASGQAQLRPATREELGAFERRTLAGRLGACLDTICQGNVRRIEGFDNQAMRQGETASVAAATSEPHS